MSRPLSDLQQDIGKWVNSIFKKGTPLSFTKHLAKEVLELQEVIRGRKPIDGELADVVILACAIAHRAGLDLETIVEDKMKVNKKRKWGLPDKDGIVEHLTTYFFTFGDGPLHKSYVTLDARNIKDARARMFAQYSGAWAFCYESAEEAGAYKFGLKHVPFGTPSRAQK